MATITFQDLANSKLDGTNIIGYQKRVFAAGQYALILILQYNAGVLLKYDDETKFNADASVVDALLP